MHRRTPWAEGGWAAGRVGVGTPRNKRKKPGLSQKVGLLSCQALIHSHAPRASRPTAVRGSPLTGCDAEKSASPRMTKRRCHARLARGSDTHRFSGVSTSFRKEQRYGMVAGRPTQPAFAAFVIPEETDLRRVPPLPSSSPGGPSPTAAGFPCGIRRRLPSRGVLPGATPRKQTPTNPTAVT